MKSTEELLERIKKLEEVVKYYADTFNWRLTPKGRIQIEDKDKSLINGRFHGGKKAREVIGEVQ